MSGAEQAATAAGLGRRLGARLIDGVVAFAAGNAFVGLMGLGREDALAAALVLTGTIVGYQVVFEAIGGITIGKQILGLRIQKAPRGSLADERSGRTVEPTGDWSIAIRRNIWLLPLAIPLLPTLLLTIFAATWAGYSIYRDPDNRGWHDRGAGSSVMRVSTGRERRTRSADEDAA